MAENCLFCKIAAGEIPAFKVYEDEVVIAFLDINPAAVGHTLVVPKAHSEGLLDTEPARLAAVMERVRKVAAHVKATLGADGFNLLQNNGAAAGQTVHHLHFHIVPRRTGEPLTFVGQAADMDALKALAERLRM